jgi:hypothetical protein
MGLPTQIMESLPEVAVPQTAPVDPPLATASEPVKETAPKRVGDYVGRRITEGNAIKLALIWKFPGADVEACSIITDRQDKPFATSGLMPTIKGTDKVLRKLEDLGAVGKHKNPDTQRAVYSLTKAGRAAAYSFGYDAPDTSTLHNTSERRANHYQMIAHVAAQFASPMGFFRDSLGIEPVGIDGVISEHEMRAAYEPVKKKLKEKKDAGESGDFGLWRKAAMRYALKAAGDGRIDWSDITESNPALLTIGEPDVEEAKTKAVHQPDLAVILDRDRDDQEARNLLVEVELNKKSWADYDSILRTYAAELSHGFIYSRVVYFTIGTQVETLLRKVDKKAKTNLFDSGRLIVLPLTHRDGTLVRFEKRISIKGA